MRRTRVERGATRASDLVVEGVGIPVHPGLLAGSGRVARRPGDAPPVPVAPASVWLGASRTRDTLAEHDRRLFFLMDAAGRHLVAAARALIESHRSRTRHHGTQRIAR
ncbi:hypothetical protein SD81_035705 [Tolypothrix campylonemoides VB511288]|nr:hypothetical protein SD81_035705 [Tolypothrix campylonemoides VB511288]